MIRFIPLIVVCFALPSQGIAQTDEALARELLERTDDMHRGESSTATITMHVKTDRYERTMTMRIWSQGEEKSLIIIEQPPKEAGTATLKDGNNIWNYLPNVDRTMKVPTTMMSGNWMGSHFTNDDLVKDSRMADDYSYAIIERPKDNEERLWVIELTPKEEAAVVWGKVVVKIRDADRVPTEIMYWNERGEPKRTMQFFNVKKIDGRMVPMTMRLIPNDKPQEFTEFQYESLDFDVEIPASTFSLQALKK